MATEVGTLLISMQADLARLRKDMSEAKGITGRAMDDITRSIDGVKNAFGLLGVGVSAGGLVMVAKQAVDAADDMAKLSQRTGIATKELAQWKLVADLSGASVETLGKGVKGLATYAKEHGDRMRALGIDTHDANAAMLQLADIVAALPDGLEKSALMSELFGGKVGAELIPALNLGGKGIAELKAKAESYAERLAALAPDAERFNDNLSELQLQSQALSIALATELVPGLVEITQAMTLAAQEGGILYSLFVGFGGVMEMSFAAPWRKTIDGLRADIHMLIAEWERGLASITFGDISRRHVLEASRQDLAAKQLLVPYTSRQQAAVAGVTAPASPWGSDAAFLARMQANILMGPRTVAKSAKAATGSVTDYAMQIQMAAGKAISDSDVVKAREYADTLAALDSLFFTAGLDADIYASALDRLAKTKDSTAESTKRLAEQESAAQRLLGMTPEGRLAAAQEQQSQAIKLLQEGRLSPEGYAAILEQIHGTRDTARQDLSLIEQGFDSLGMHAKETFAEILVGGKATGRDLVQAWLRDLAQLQAKALFDPLTQAASRSLSGAIGNLFGSSTLGQMATPSIGEEFPVWLGNNAHGGDYTIPGSGGTDSQLVAFRATPGERVSVRTPAQADAAPSIVLNIDARGADMGAAARLESVAQRIVQQAVSAVAATADRGGAYARVMGRRR